MYLHKLLVLTGFAAIVKADPPFPIITKSVPTQVASKIESDISSYVASIYSQPAWTSAASALSSEAPDLADQYGDDPVSLAVEFLLASATPTWYGGLPNDVQQYVSSVAAAQASIASKDSGARSNRLVWIEGVMIAAGAAAVLLL